MSQERPARPRTGEEPSGSAAGPPRAGIAAGEAGGRNPAILLGCILAGRGEVVDWRSVAEAAVLLEAPVAPPEKPADRQAGG